MDAMLQGVVQENHFIDSLWFKWVPKWEDQADQKALMIIQKRKVHKQRLKPAWRKQVGEKQQAEEKSKRRSHRQKQTHSTLKWIQTLKQMDAAHASIPAKTMNIHFNVNFATYGTMQRVKT